MALEIHIFFYDLIRKVFPQKIRIKFKNWLKIFKNYSKGLILFIYKTVDDEELFEHIKEKLEAEPYYEILFIHSSYDNMKPVYIGNVNNLLKKLMAYCNQRNITLAMPAFTFFDDNQATIDYYSNHIFDVKKSVSKMGLITEIFRRIANVKRSIHPTHSICAYGPLAEEMTCTHHLADTTFGKGTPFAFMTEHKTKILGIGVNYYRVLTQVHTSENMIGNKTYFKSELQQQMNITCANNNGQTFLFKYKFYFKGPIRRAQHIRNILKGNITEWKFKNIKFFMTEAKSVTDTLVKAFENGLTIYS